MKLLALLAVACLVCSAACQINLLLQPDCREVTIRGRINDNADHFGVDFYSTSEKGKIPFHFNPRFGARWGSQVPYIVLNSNNGVQWNTEVNKATSLKPGSEFKLRIFVSDAFTYDVYLDGEYFNSLPWRMDHFMNAQAIRIGGDVTISSISRSFYFNPVINTLSTNPFSVNLDTISEIRIRGRLGDKARSIQYNLRNGNAIPLHAHFRMYEPQNCLALVTYDGRTWTRPEQLEKVPYARGEVFSHKIVIDSKGFNLSDENFSYNYPKPAEVNLFTIDADQCIHAGCDTRYQIFLSKVTLTKRY